MRDSAYLKSNSHFLLSIYFSSLFCTIYANVTLEYNHAIMCTNHWIKITNHSLPLSNKTNCSAFILEKEYFISPLYFLTQLPRRLPSLWSSELKTASKYCGVNLTEEPPKANRPLELYSLEWVQNVTGFTVVDIIIVLGSSSGTFIHNEGNVEDAMYVL